MGAVDAYLRRIVVNEHISMPRRKRRLAVAIARDRLSPLAVPDTSQVTVDRAAMWQALASLPPKQRAVLVLRYYEDLTDDQIAAILQCRAGTVRSNASRALQALRVATATPVKEEEHESAINRHPHGHVVTRTDFVRPPADISLRQRGTRSGCRVCDAT